jgi:type I restriction enzyme R subunit
LTGLRTPGYNRRADLVCFVNGLPLVFIELKAVHKNIRNGFDSNLSDYLDEHVISHAFDHNAFLIVSNGHRARYGTITSRWEHFAEWKRLKESDKGSVEAEMLLNGMLAHDRLLDILENYILFDTSKPGQPRKIVARNHQVLGVNSAVDSVHRQEELCKRFPPGKRYKTRVIDGHDEKNGVIFDNIPERLVGNSMNDLPLAAEAPPVDPDHKFWSTKKIQEARHSTQQLKIIELAHPDLGRLGVFWHTQGSGKSYSMVFFSEKVRRQISAKFTFLIMTDRNDLDSQIYRTFVGCGVCDNNTPRASSGEELKRLLKDENHRYIFSLIHKFNKDVDIDHPYSLRDDIIVISDEAHRTQAGKLAINMRKALPNASFIGFTGTPIFKNDQPTRRIFGNYITCYDFKRSVEDGATVRLIYENRGEKLGLTRLDLNDRIAEAIEQSELDPDQEMLLEKLLGKDYEVITDPHRLDKIADDFVDHCSTRWESGKSMLVCIDKFTCAKMYQQIIPRWQDKLAALRNEIGSLEMELAGCTDEDERSKVSKKLDWLKGQAAWMAETQKGIAVIVSEGQNEVSHFMKWGFDILPHRALMKQGFETPDGKRVDVETAFKNPDHPFRVAIVCAMWLTGFDVECLSMLYVDKSMRAHSLMQAISRANRVYPGKDFGLIVDYNGILRSINEAMAQYTQGDENAGEEIVEPIEERVAALESALTAAENHLRSLGFEPDRLKGAKGFVRIAALADGAEAVIGSSGEGRRIFEILAREIFSRFKSLITERSVYAYAVRRDDIEAIYKKLEERRDTADVAMVLEEIHRIVGDAIRTAEIGDDQRDSKYYDLSKIDMEKLREAFAHNVKRKATTLEDIRIVVEKKLHQMLRFNPQRMDYYKRYSDIIADYNREKDRVTIEDTFSRLMDLVKNMDAETRQAAEEGLSEEQYAIFCLLQKDNLSRADREKIKQASIELFDAVRVLICQMDRWWEKEQTQSEMEVAIQDQLYSALPSLPFTDDEILAAAGQIYQHIWQQCRDGHFSASAAG